MSRQSKKRAGIVMVMVEEFERHRLPHLLVIKKSVESGNILSDEDVIFLDKVIEDATRTMPLTVSNPELHEFCAHVIHLYKEITVTALENEE